MKNNVREKLDMTRFDTLKKNNSTMSVEEYMGEWVFVFGMNYKEVIDILCDVYICFFEKAQVKKANEFAQSLPILNDMNILGAQIYWAYTVYCQSDPEKFLDAVKNRDPNLVKCVNMATAANYLEQDAYENNKAIEQGAALLNADDPKLFLTDNEIDSLFEEYLNNGFPTCSTAK